MLAVIDSVIKIIEKIIELVTHQSANRRKLFEDHIEPLHRALIPLAEDCLLLYKKALELLSKPDVEDYQDILDELKKRRDKYWHLRHELYSMALAVEERYKDDIIRKYTESIVIFFHGNTSIHFGSRPADLLFYIGTVDCDGVEIDMTPWIEDHIALLEKYWDSYCKAYAELKIHCLK